MRDYVTKVATVDEAGEVTRLLRASYPELMKTAYPESVLGPALERMTEANLGLLESGRFYVARSTNGETVGCGGWSIERPGDRTVEPELAHVRHFATHPDWIGRGVGRALYLRCERDARAAGCTRFECYASLNAERFYGALGFDRISMLRVEMGPGVFFPSVRMIRSI